MAFQFWMSQLSLDVFLTCLYFWHLIKCPFSFTPELLFPCYHTSSPWPFLGQGPYPEQYINKILCLHKRFYDIFRGSKLSSGFVFLGQPLENGYSKSRDQPSQSDHAFNSFVRKSKQRVFKSPFEYINKSTNSSTSSP